jgi:hypothetical protein
MATVADTPTTRNPKAFYATFHGLSGVLTKPADHVLFLEHESSAVVTITEADMPHLVVLGEVAPAMAQYVADMAAGGYAAIACSRDRAPHVR